MLAHVYKLHVRDTDSPIDTTLGHRGHDGRHMKPPEVGLSPFRDVRPVGRLYRMGLLSLIRFKK
jgi:hypothetical protein